VSVEFDTAAPASAVFVRRINRISFHAQSPPTSACVLSPCLSVSPQQQSQQQRPANAQYDLLPKSRSIEYESLPPNQVSAGLFTFYFDFIFVFLTECLLV
jgi:hypothetical protein